MAAQLVAVGIGFGGGRGRHRSMGDLELSSSRPQPIKSRESRKSELNNSTSPASDNLERSDRFFELLLLHDCLLCIATDDLQYAV